MRPGLRFYADAPGRRMRQIVGDLLVVAWVALWVRVGLVVHERSKTQGQGAAKLESAGGDFSRSMGDAAAKMERVPLVGSELRPPFDRAATAGTYVAQAGRDIQVGTDQLGQLLGVLVAALPICLVLSLWAQARWRYAQRVRLAQALEAYDGHNLDVVRRIAGLDLASLGLRTAAPIAAALPPRPAPSSAGDRPLRATATPADEAEPDETIELNRRPEPPGPA